MSSNLDNSCPPYIHARIPLAFTAYCLPLTAYLSVPRPAAHQVFRQRPVKLHACIERHVVDAELKTVAPVIISEIADRADVFGLKIVGIDLQLVRAFPALRIRPCRRRETSPRPRRGCETRSRRAPVPQPAQRRKHRLRLGQQIGKQHHQAAMPQHGGDLDQAFGDVGLAGRLQLGQQRQHVPNLRPLARGRQALANLLVERDQPAPGPAGGPSGSTAPRPGRSPYSNLVSSWRYV